jgi:prefoldin subunit 5
VLRARRDEIAAKQSGLQQRHQQVVSQVNAVALEIERLDAAKAELTAIITTAEKAETDTPA